MMMWPLSVQRESPFGCKGAGGCGTLALRIEAAGKLSRTLWPPHASVRTLADPGHAMAAQAVQTDRQTDSQSFSQSDRQTDRQTDR